MTAIDVLWKHEFDLEPVRLIAVLDCYRYEVRKLEFFRDGRVGYADGSGSSARTALGVLEVPSLAAINADPQFEAREIALEDFDALWRHHVPWSTDYMNRRSDYATG